MYKKVFVWHHLGLGDIIMMNGGIRYLRTKYDYVLVVCLDKFVHNFENIYRDDNNIKPYIINEDLNPQKKKNEFISIIHQMEKDKYEILLGGRYKHRKEKGWSFIYDYPLSMYDDMNIPNNVFYDYFKIHIPQESEDLYNAILIITNNYIFVHQSAGRGGDNSKYNFIEKYNIDINETLVIDPDNNLYEKGDKFYELCDKFIKLPLNYYYHIMKNSNKLYLIDSCYHAMAMHIDNPNIEKYYFLRSDQNYPYKCKDSIICIKK